MYKSKYIIIFIIFFFSCTSNQEIKYPVAEIRELNIMNSKPANLSTLFDSLSYIKLEDKKNEALLKEVSKIEIHKDTIYVLDKESNKICLFNSNGNFITQLGNIGQGPGEFIKVSDFTMDYAANKIIVLDILSSKINIYNSNGTFDHEIHLECMARQLVATKNHYIFYTAGSNYYTSKEKKSKPEEKLGYNLFITDKKGNILQKFFYYKPILDDLLCKNTLSYDKKNDIAYFHYAVYDTIYAFSPKGNTKYWVNFGKNRMPYKKMNEDNFKFYTNKTGFAQLINICCSDNYIFANYSLNNKVHLFINKLNTKEITNISFIKNDFDKTSFALTYPHKIVENKVYFSKRADHLLSNYKSDSVYLKQNGEKIFITSESNPILVIGYLK